MDRKPSAPRGASDSSDRQRLDSQLGEANGTPSSGSRSGTSQFWLLAASWTAAGAWICFILHLSNSGTLSANRVFDLVMLPMAAVVLVSLLACFLFRGSPPPPSDGPNGGTRVPSAAKTADDADPFVGAMRLRMETALQDLNAVVRRADYASTAGEERIQHVFLQLQHDAMALAWIHQFRPSPTAPAPQPAFASFSDLVRYGRKCTTWLMEDFGVRGRNLPALAPKEPVLRSPDEPQTRLQVWMDRSADVIKDLMLDWSLSEKDEDALIVAASTERGPARRAGAGQGSGWGEKYRRMALAE